MRIERREGNGASKVSFLPLLKRHIIVIEVPLCQAKVNNVDKFVVFR
jgi:hypothetical protein